MDMNEDMSRYIEPTFADTLFLSTTIQAGVGYTLLTPKTELSKYYFYPLEYLSIPKYTYQALAIVNIKYKNTYKILI